MLNCKTVTKGRKRKGFCFFFLVAGLLTPSLLVLGSLYFIHQHQKCEVWNDKGWWNVLWIHLACRVHASRAVGCFLCWELYKVWIGSILILTIQYRCCVLMSIWILASSYSSLEACLLSEWNGKAPFHTAKIPQIMREVTFPWLFIMS